MSATVAVLVVLAGLAFWAAARARARAPIEALRQSAGELSACVARVRGGRPSLEDALSLRLPEDRPLAECVPALERLERAHTELSHASFLRVRSELARLGGELDVVRAVGLGRTTTELAERPLGSLESALDNALKTACRVEAVELQRVGDECIPGEPPPLPPLPAPRRLLEVSSNVPFEAVLAQLDAHGDAHANLALLARERYDEHFRAWLLASDDGAKSFTTAAFDGPPIGEGPVDPPRLSEHGPAGDPRFLVVSRHDRAGRPLGVVLRVGAGKRVLVSERALPEPPAGFDFVPAGAPLVELATKHGPTLGFALFAVGRDDATGQVLYVEPNDSVHARATPPGRVLALSALGAPRIIVAEAGANEAGTVAAYPVPGPDEPWSQTPERVLVPSARYHAEATAEQACGLPDEKFFSLVASDDPHAAFIALGTSRLFALSFARPKASTLVTSCGSCPPMLLEKNDDGLGLLLPAGKTITKIPVPTASSYRKSAKGRIAASACAAGHYAVAYVAARRVLVQTAGPSSWHFSEPRVLAERDEHGSPVDVALTALGARLIVVWRRESSDQKQFSVELLASDDGGLSWR